MWYNFSTSLKKETINLDKYKEIKIDEKCIILIGETKPTIIEYLDMTDAILAYDALLDILKGS